MKNLAEIMILWSEDEGAMRICVEKAQSIWGDRVMPVGVGPALAKGAQPAKPILVFLLPPAVSKHAGDRERRKDYVNWISNEKRLDGKVFWHECWGTDDGNFTMVAYGVGGAGRHRTGAGRGNVTGDEVITDPEEKRKAEQARKEEEERRRRANSRGYDDGWY